MDSLSPNTRHRFQSIDLLRGVAVLGILMMNIPYFAYPETPLEHVTDFTGINLRSWQATLILKVPCVACSRCSLARVVY